MKKALQAKHIPDRAVLESVQYHQEYYGGFFTIWAVDYPFLPIKVLRAKMNRLRDRGLINACCNLCNSGITLTEKGASLL